MNARDAIRKALVDCEEITEAHVKVFDRVMALWAFHDYPLCGENGDLKTTLYLFKQYLSDVTGEDHPLDLLCGLRGISIAENRDGRWYVHPRGAGFRGIRGTIHVSSLLGYSTSEGNICAKSHRPISPDGWSRIDIFLGTGVTRAFLPEDREIPPDHTIDINHPEHPMYEQRHEWAEQQAKRIEEERRSSN